MIGAKTYGDHGRSRYRGFRRTHARAQATCAPGNIRERPELALWQPIVRADGLMLYARFYPVR
jgi:hypothetical protein